jgi:hypothetical protein
MLVVDNDSAAMTGPRLIPAILSLSIAGAAWAQPADTPDHLSAVPGMRFVPGRLTDLQTPPGAPHSLEVSHGYELLMDLGPEGGCPPNCAADADVYLIGQKPRPLGKTVALEPATGFSFDSPSLPRIR